MEGVMPNKIKNIAFYLPQFYPFPENDEWWGKGFTEWTNTTKAKPLFKNHYQPHLPTDLGFYDLRVRETQYDQMALAKEYGIDAFCYHYYWFSGKRLLDRPVDDMLKDPKADMPFLLCWANENWTRRWDASDQTVLIAQKYSKDNDIKFIESVIPFFEDPRYVRLDDAPVLIVYRPQHLPNAKETLETWRKYCAKIGIPKLHLVCAMVHGNTDYKQYGFDAGVQFPPHAPTVEMVTSSIDLCEGFSGHVANFKDIANSYNERVYEDDNIYRTVFPSWDNAARTGPRSFIILNGTPGNYEYWLKKATQLTQEQYPDQERFVFINAWNEWAEGCHLEPDRKYGRGFLEATLRVKNGASTLTNFPDTSLPPQRKNDALHNTELEVDAPVYRRSMGNSVYHRAKRWANPILTKLPWLRYVLRKIRDRIKS